jgi:hypothetical protein
MGNNELFDQIADSLGGLSEEAKVSLNDIGVDVADGD